MFTLALIAYLAAASTTPGPGISTFDVLVPSERIDGTLWFHSLPPTKSAGSAQLGAFDLGPPSPPATISGINAAWLEWNQTRVYTGLLGGGLSSIEVTVDPPFDLSPIVNCLGAATVNGGWIISSDMFTGAPTSIRPCLGSFIWTESKLHLMALGGGVDVDEVTIGGASIGSVLGVSVLASSITDLSTTPGVVAANIAACALVFTPAHLYYVQVDLSAGAAYTISEVFAGGTAIAKVRGITGVAAGLDSTGFPGGVNATGAAYVWNDAHVYFVTIGTILAVSEVMKPSGGGPIDACWGVMAISGSDSSIPGGSFRNAAQVWQQSKAWISILESTLTVREATIAPGAPSSGALVSNVLVPTVPTVLLVERQASFLYEILAQIVLPSGSQRGLVVGANQRNP